MRNRILQFAAATIMAGWLSQNANAVELSVYYTDPNLLREVHEENARKFEALNPDIKLKLVSVGATDEILSVVFREALTDQLPDVAYVSMNHLPLLAERELGTALDPLFSASKDGLPGVDDAALSMGRIDGKLIGVPFSVGMPVVFYNADIVRAAGVDPDSFPTSWSEIVELGKRLKAPSGGIFYDYEATGNWTFISLVQSLGGSMLNPDHKSIAFDDAAGMKALQILRSVGSAGAVGMTRDQARQAFAAGALGILVTSSSGLGNYERQAAGKFEIRVAPFPIEAEGGKVPAAGFAVVTFANDSEKKVAAWKYIQFVTNPESQTLMVQKTGYAPVNKTSIETPGLLGSFYNSRPNSATIVNMLPKMTAWVAFPGVNSLKINEVIKQSLRDVVTQQKTPEEVMPDLKKNVEALLPK